MVVGLDMRVEVRWCLAFSLSHKLNPAQLLRDPADFPT